MPTYLLDPKREKLEYMGALRRAQVTAASRSIEQHAVPQPMAVSHIPKSPQLCRVNGQTNSPASRIPVGSLNFDGDGFILPSPAEPSYDSWRNGWLTILGKTFGFPAKQHILCAGTPVTLQGV